MEDGAYVDGQLIGQIANPARGGSDARSTTRGTLRATRARPTSIARRSARQRIEVAGERGATITLALRRLEREHVALLLAICELEGPTGAAVGAFTEPPAMREALLVLLRDDLSRTQHALALAAEGRYGLCEDCQRPIARRELELSPTITQCAVCETLASRSFMG